MRFSWFPVLFIIFFLGVFAVQAISHSRKEKPPETKNSGWETPDINLVPNTPEGDLIRYGRELIVNTSFYFGPKGKIAVITNGMNCQNCHISAGTRLFGNNFAAVAANYPRYRNRSGQVESIEFRVNDCMQRSMNGKSIDSLSREMRAMVAYLRWVGKEVTPKTKPSGSGIIELPFLNRAADTIAGKKFFQAQCSRCHGENGEGMIYPDSSGYIYPPLWGMHSYNISAGLYRLSSLASFIRYNMPFDKTVTGFQLNDDQAWDVAAYIVAMPRPVIKFPQDWPKLETKPPDYPFGPYTDRFSELQHKYGPFIPIQQAHSNGK